LPETPFLITYFITGLDFHCNNAYILNRRNAVFKMITVEELIVQSLYHRLVLIKVRRTPEPRANNDDDNAGPQSALINEAVTSSEGLGKQTLTVLEV